MEGTILQIVTHTAILVIGTVFLTMGLAGFFLIPFNKIERIAMFAAGVCVCIPESVSDIIGFVIGGAILVEQLIRRIRKNRSGSGGDNGTPLAADS